MEFLSNEMYARRARICSLCIWEVRNGQSITLVARSGKVFQSPDRRSRLLFLEDCDGGVLEEGQIFRES